MQEENVFTKEILVADGRRLIKKSSITLPPFTNPIIPMNNYPYNSLPTRSS